jgi:hypothetical protein
LKKTFFSFPALILIAFAGYGQTYFQQGVNYKINVKLDDVKHELLADETIEYINNSPSDLTIIYMHLWPNAYKNNETALATQLLLNGSLEFYNAKAKDRGFIDQLDFAVDGKKVQWAIDSVNIDICKLILNEPLKSGGRITISTPFHVKIPKGVFSRLGHLDQQYQITQWYPKPAVFDKEGWHPMSYLDQGEFYSEFGSYDVSITVPANYVVGATGDLPEGDPEIAWLNNKAEETEGRSTFPKDKFPPSDQKTKTLRYRQSQVHDFAWFADKRYNVLKGEVVLPHSKRKVTTWVMFTNGEAPLWKNSIPYVNDAVYYYSLWNGDYPYNHVTAVDGALSAGGGMEYPNITVIGKSDNAMVLETVIMHEVGHNWFYGILGSNERDHAWMDEGINSFNENRYIETKYPDARLLGEFAKSKTAKKFDVDFYKHKSEYELTYMYNAAKNEDQPLEQGSAKFTQFNYAGGVYAKTALIFDYLMAYLGEETFDKCMQAYFEAWKFRHPHPENLRRIFEEKSGKDLSWFFDDLIKKTKKIDYKLSKISSTPENFELQIRNKGKVAGPVSVSAIKDGKEMKTIWYEGFKGKQLVKFPAGDYDKFKIDFLQDIPEVNRNNNTIKTKGIFKTVEPFKMQFLGSLKNPDKTQLMFAPIVGWNNYDKTMLGLAFFNNIVPQRKLEFILAPMYSTNTNDVSGYGSVYYNCTQLNGFFRQITLGVNTARFTYDWTSEHDFRFNKIAPEITFYFKKNEPTKNIDQSVKYRNVNIFQDRLNGFNKDLFHYSVNVLTYLLEAKRTKNPFSGNIEFQGRTDMVRASLTGGYRISYKKQNKGIDLRLFAGAFFYNNVRTHNRAVNDLNDYRFKQSGKSPESRFQSDYLFDEVFLGRSEYDGVLSQQMTQTEGAFKVYNPFAASSDWITSLNIEIPAPGKLPLRFFADIGTYEGIKDSFLPPVDISFDAGIAFSFINDFFRIYIPLGMSKELQYYTEKVANPERELKLSEMIRFQINFKMMNPFHLVKNIQI